MNMNKVLDNRFDAKILLTRSELRRQWYYRDGHLPPNYPLPVTELDNLLAMPHHYITFKTKEILVRLMS